MRSSGKFWSRAFGSLCINSVFCWPLILFFFAPLFFSTYLFLLPINKIPWPSPAKLPLLLSLERVGSARISNPSSPLCARLVDHCWPVTFQAPMPLRERARSSLTSMPALRFSPQWRARLARTEETCYLLIPMENRQSQTMVQQWWRLDNLDWKIWNAFYWPIGPSQYSCWISYTRPLESLPILLVPKMPKLEMEQHQSSFWRVRS